MRNLDVPCRHALGLALIFVASCTSAGPPPEAKVVSFLPTPSGTAGAFLVAGPFETPRPDLEREKEPKEGNIWRLSLATKGDAAVSLGAPVDYLTEPSGMRFWYATAELPGQAQPFRVELASTGKAKFFAGGTLKGELRPYERGRFLANGRILIAFEGPRPPRFALQVERDSTTGAREPVPLRLHLADARKARLAELTARVLELKLDPQLVREGGTVTAELAIAGPCPLLEGKTELALTCAGTRRTAGRSYSLPELALQPARCTFPVPPDPPARLEVEAELVLDGERLVRLRSSCLVLERMEHLAAHLEKETRALETAPPSARAYIMLQAEKIRLGLSRLGGPRKIDSLVRDLEAAEIALEEAKRGRDFQAGRTGAFERAYFSEVDESPQPYLVYVPSGCTPGTGPWPMVVYLHGYVPSYDKDDWLEPDPVFNAVMEQEGCILAIPFGRSNTDFRNVGEDDVLRVIDEMKSAYPVDPDRIYLYGYSMGGLGTWTLLCHYPDLFAGAVVVSGQSDHYLWHNVDRNRFPAWWRQLIETDNPIELATNIVHVPVRVYHGEADYVVKPEHSIRMVERLRELGGKAELHILRGANHWSVFEEVMWKREPVAWLKQHRLGELPREFAVKAGHPRYAQFGWDRNGFAARISALRDPLMPCELKRSVTDAEVKLEVLNAAAVEIRMPSSQHKMTLEAIDGAEYVRSSGPGGLISFVERSLQAKGALRKSAALSGPVKEVFRSPFCAVYGTAGDTAELREKAERFVKEWRDFAKGRPPILADVDVTPELERTKNLVLFGEPETNKIIARIAGRLPIRWNREEVEIPPHRYPLTGRGLMFVYPNPDNPGRLVLIMSGIPWGQYLSINHKWDHVPDYILFEAEKDLTDRMDPVNKAVVAGFFGPDWSLGR